MGRKTWFTGCILPFLILAIVPIVHGQDFETEVVGVERGDLLTIHHQGKKVELALYGVECPAPGEPHGSEARQFTLRMVFHEQVRIQVRERESESKIAGSSCCRMEPYSTTGSSRTGSPPGIGKTPRMISNCRPWRTLQGICTWGSGPPPPRRLNKPSSRVSPQPVTSKPSKALPWTSLLSTVLALLAATAMALFFARKFQRARDEESAPSPPVRKQAPQGISRRKKRPRPLNPADTPYRICCGASPTSSRDLVENNQSYDTKMKDHKVSIDQAMTMAGLEEIKRLLVHEIEDMQSTSEDYRRQLEHANVTIRDQQEILERFRIDSKMDFLTKIANRRAFETRLTEEFERTKRYSSVFTLIMVDIDHFKKVNDVYGHLAGDQILRLVAQVLEDQTRFNDFVSRYGGEEFVRLAARIEG